MANDEVIGPRKTMFVLVIVVGCFAVLWPRILSPLVLGPSREQLQPNQFDRDAGCCEVIFEADVAVLELVNEVCNSAFGSSQSVAECRKAVNETCGVDIAVFLKRNENVGKTTKMLVETMQNSNSSCLREHFGVPVYSLGHHLAANSWNIKDTLKQERASPMRGMGPHPALRERGRAIPPGPPGPPPPASKPIALPPHIRVRSPLSGYYEFEQPPPIPGMRPPLGSPGGPVPAPKSSMGFVMPIYTICIIVFFVYTLSKILFRRTASPYDSVAPDPQFRRRVFRDDSRSSPDKLGKKEADTIVTAISGLVAEVQQQMEASNAQNQQRQEMQDNARPYTNGTILLNTGPVQIVTSEYKDASKEKTPEPVKEKGATLEPKEKEPTKVVKELSPEQDVVIPECNQSSVEPKEYIPEISAPTPEHAFEKEATLETMVNETSQPKPSFPEPKESTVDSKAVKEPAPEPIIYSVEAPLESEEAKTLINDIMSTSLSHDSSPIPAQQIIESEFDLISDDTAQILDPVQSLLESIESSTLLRELSPDSIESSTKPYEDSTPEDISAKPLEIPQTHESKRSSPVEIESQEYPKPVLEPKENSSDFKEYSHEPKESSSSPVLEKHSPELQEYFPESKTKDIISEYQSLQEPEVSSDAIKHSNESEETIPDPKEILNEPYALQVIDSIPDVTESLPELNDSISEQMLSTLDSRHRPVQIQSAHKESPPESTEPLPIVDAPVVESSSEPTVDTSGLKEPTSQSKESTPEPKDTTETNNTTQIENNAVPEGALLDLEEAIAELDDATSEVQKEDHFKEIKPEQIEVEPDEKASAELMTVFESPDATGESQTHATDQFLNNERFTVTKRTTPEHLEDVKGRSVEVLSAAETPAAFKVLGMELTAHPADNSAWPRDLPSPPPPAHPHRAPHEAEEVKSIFLETEIPQQSRLLVAQFEEGREESPDQPVPSKHAPLVVSGKMTLSLIQDAPRETPERDPESTVDEFTTASAVTQPAAEKGEMESDEEVDEEIEVEEIEEEIEEEVEEEEEEEPPSPVKKTGAK